MKPPHRLKAAGQLLLSACGSSSSSPTSAATPLPPATWTPTNTVNTPAAMSDPYGVWTGSQMIVWGEQWPDGVGGMFDPVANGWTRWLSVTNGPGSRAYGSAVWTGSKIIVWGGPYIIFEPVETAVWNQRPSGAPAVLPVVQVSVAGS